MSIKNVYQALHQPEYTGENRCTPCTIANVAIAAVASLVLAAAFPLLGVVAFAAFVAVIYLRGYLVPGTPTLTKEYLPERVLAWFDKAPAPEVEYTVHGDADAEIDVEETLVSVGALEECQDGADLCLTPEFRESWYDTIDRLSDREDARAVLADVIGVSAPRLTLDERRSAFVASLDGTRVGRWESEAAFVADMAAERALRDRTHGWADLPVEHRSSLLSSLRVFLDRCPNCGGRVTMDEETKESCCRSWDVLANTCEECDARLFEVQTAQVAEAAE